MPTLKISDLCYSVEQTDIITDICLEIQSGEFVGLVGPNGSGKSTLLKTVYKLLKPQKGAVLLDGQNLLGLSNKEAARELAVVAQESGGGFEFTVEEIVMMGRHPYKTLFESDSTLDEEIVSRCLQRVGMFSMKDRSFTNLSGGEKQRVLIARALVQDTSFLILDEPTNHLDIGYQIGIMDLIKSIGITTFAAIHDLNIAAMYCDRVIILKDGQIINSGSPRDIFTAELILDLFGIEVEFYTNKRTGALQFSTVPTIHTKKGRTVHAENIGLML